MYSRLVGYTIHIKQPTLVLEIYLNVEQIQPLSLAVEEHWKTNTVEVFEKKVLVLLEWTNS
jgi:hypothetical protein